MANYAGGNVLDVMAVVATIDPDSYSAGSVNTDVVDAQDWTELAFIVKTGVLGASATVDFLVKGDSTSGGSFTTTVTGKSFTQLVKASNDDDQVILRVTSEELAAQGFRYVRGTLTVGTAASYADVTVLGFRPKYGSAVDYDLDSVVEVIM